MPRGIVQTAYSLSPMQQGMLFHGLGPDPGVHLDQVVLTLPERVNEDALVDAWQLVSKRHDALRTRFRWEDVDDASQEVIADAPMPVTRLDWRALADDERAARLETFLVDDRRRGIVLSDAPLMRLALIRTHDDRYSVVWTHHHSIIDGRSKLRVLSEVFDLYDGSGGTPVDAHQLREHVEAVSRRDRLAARDFFRAELGGHELPTPFPFAPPRADSVRRGGHGEVELRLARSLTKSLDALARDAGVTLNTVVQTGLGILLARYTGATTVVYGATRAGRHSVPGGDTIVGLMISTVPLRVDVDDDRTLGEHLSELRRRWVALRPYEHTPLLEVREAIDHRSARPLFETLLVFDAVELEEALQSRNERWSKRDVRQIAHTDAPFTFVVSGGASMVLRLEHDHARLDETSARRVLGHLETLLRAMTRGVDQRVGDLPILSEPERALLLDDWAGPSTPFDDATLHGLVRAAASRHPDAVALESFGTVVTYRELVRASRVLARELGRAGVGRGARVCTLLERGPALAVAWLAVLERGAAFVPVDPEHPRSHLAYVLEDSGTSVVLTTRQHAARVPVAARPVLVSLGELAGAADPDADGEPAAVSPDDDAYVIYTSGSTGAPKGVAVSHRAVTNHARAIAQAYKIVPGDRAVQFASPAFDVALEEVFPVWAAGACVVTRPDDVLSSDRFARWVEASRATILNLPTAYWHEWTQGLSSSGTRVPASVRLVVVGGERASPAAFSRFRTLAGPGVRLLNAYGPTEATITATFFDAARAPNLDAIDDVPIGRPIANVRAYVLDRRLRPAPVGVAGELFLAGAGVARGYVGDTASRARADDRFLSDPFRSEVGARMYRTGDRARWLTDGELAFLGRADDQLKVRGFRIEPLALERTLMEHPAVHDAAVLAVRDGAGELRLIAYVARNRGTPVDVAELRSRMRDRWPAPMVPSEIVLMDSLPRNNSDKIDRAALLPPVRDPAPTRKAREVDAPTSPVEELLASIWAGALGRDRVGINDDFFDLGGHSLLTLKIIDRAARAGLRITTEQLLRHPTVARLAAVVEMRWAEESEGTVVIMRDQGERPPIFLVHSTPGDLLGYVNLVHALGPSQPVYGLQSLGLRRPDAAHVSIDSMAAHYVACMRRAQAKGPYYLAGWCYGGIVALEMARLLARAGERVALLAMMEAWAPKPALFVPRYYADRVRAVASLGPAGVVGLVRGKVEEVWSRRGRTLRDHLVYEVSTGVLANRALVLEANLRAIETYRSRPYDGHLTLFRASEGVTVPDRFMGWASLCRSVDVHDVRGRHETILHAPQVKVLAALLRSAIDRGGAMPASDSTRPASSAERTVSASHPR